ncbi:M1 family metallopeptidase [Wenyingzhuangia aestuarii]|uniref:M1 family metallopeptidase n=1 Tax=Wenyingzhuangia aestuarii TaxID=1647582 RepID=UPI0014398087|nr:M1 family metallopeptidase [Wenyingzhuangia aestuarii]NJB83841.1 aminopeptidase N [Wenyingzhuangia aestuarii]
MYKSFFLLILISFGLQAQNSFTKQDSLRGSITNTRAWWDVAKYTLDISVFPETKTILGSNTITYKILRPHQTLQFELQAPLIIDSILQNKIHLTYTKTGISYFVNLTKKQKVNNTENITIYYHGKPKETINPPWDGGIIWSKDTHNNHFIATANQSIGSSVWWPCKDHPADEAESMEITVTCPTPLINVSNGKCTRITRNKNNTTSYTWQVNNPINDYGISMNIANYAHFNETYKGLNGDLTCDYYVLSSNYLKAKIQFKDVPKTLKAFEYWMGPYPFYKDGYKLVEVPYLGMEHQSCIGYGNHYQKGYLGKRMGLSPWGLEFDYIIIHESGHEWFANNITCKDVADLWIHESFTTYAESLYIDYYYGTQAANDYVQGLKPFVKNNKPIIGKFNVHNQGSGDMYFKGSLMLHTLRQIINNDTLWRTILIDLNKTFYHKTVSGTEIINFINTKTKIDLTPFFHQYLNTTKIPKLILRQDGNSITYQWENTVANFSIPVKVYLKNQEIWITPNANNKQRIKGKLDDLKVDLNYYIHIQKE